MRNKICSFRHLTWNKISKQLHIFQIPCDSFIGNNFYFFTNIFSPLVYLIVNISEISDVFNIPHTKNFPEKPEQNVEYYYISCVSQMSAIIHSRTAQIHPYITRVYRFKNFFFSNFGVMQLYFEHMNTCILLHEHLYSFLQIQNRISSNSIIKFISVRR